MVPLRFFRSRTFTGANIDSFMVAFLITAISFFMTLYQQNVHGYSPIKTGLALLPMVVVMMVLSPISGALVSRMGSRMLLSFGLAVTAVGTLLFLFSGATASYWDILPAFLVLGVGMSFIWAPMTTAVLNSVEKEKSGIASAVNGALREIGTAFGVALLGTMANRAYQDNFSRASEIKALRADPSLAALHPVIDAIGSGASMGGKIIYNQQLFPGVAQQAPDFAAKNADVSARAFVVGMDRAVIFSGVAMLIVSVLSYIMISDKVVDSAPVEEPVALSDRYEEELGVAD
jgi:MFS family permease